MGLEFDIEVGVLGVRDFQRGRVGRVIQQVLGDVAAIKCHPHLRAHAGTSEQHMQKDEMDRKHLWDEFVPNASKHGIKKFGVQTVNHNTHSVFMHTSGRVRCTD